MKKLSKQYSLDSGVFSRKRQELSAKFDSEPNTPDVLWGIFNDMAIELMRDVPVNYSDLSGVYFDQAMFLYESNKPFYKTLQEANRMYLLMYQQQGVKKVEIPDFQDACKECQKVGNRVLTIDQALKEMPIPHKGCTYELKEEKPGWCRCCYSPAME
jgi:hypothetical protein